MGRPAKINLSKDELEYRYIELNQRVFEIANELGISDKSVSYYLKKFNIPLRPKKFENIRENEEFDRLIFKKIIRKNIASQKGLRLYAQCICRCDGKEFECYLSSLINGKTRSCGCLSQEQKIKGCSYEEITGTFWSHVRQRATKKNMDFTMTKKYVWEKYIRQDRRCVYTGIELILPKHGDKKRHLGNASIDRIDSNIGYINGNIQWVDKRIQFMKYTLSDKEFKELCYMVNDYTRKIS